MTEFELNKVPEPILQRVKAGSFLSLPSHKASSRQLRNKKMIGYFSEVFRDRLRGRKVGPISDTDASWACDSREATAREERHARAVGYSLATNPYCS